jgi:tight adherence protein B
VNPLIITLATFVAGALVVLGLYSLVFDLVLRDRERVSQRLREEFRQHQRKQIQKSPIFKDLGKNLPELSGDTEKAPSLQQRLQLLIEQSGLDISPRRLLGIMGATGLGLGVLVGILSKVWWAGLVVVPVGLVVPLLFVNIKRKRRLDKLLSQLPDAFELIGRLIRAGQTMGQAFQGVADEFQPPIAAEFAYAQEQQNLGLSPDIALRDLGRRIGLVEMKIFILAILVQRQTGGNLGELIDNLAGIVRERFRIKGKIRVLTAEGRMEAAVLLALPPVVFTLIYFLNPNYASILFEHPKVIWGMAAFMLVGLIWIRRIINFDF